MVALKPVKTCKIESTFELEFLILGTMSTDNLVRIAEAGGSMIVPHGISIPSLVRIAAAAAHGHTQITIKGATKMLTDDMIRIAAAAKGCVIFDFTS